MTYIPHLLIQVLTVADYSKCRFRSDAFPKRGCNFYTICEAICHFVDVGMCALLQTCAEYRSHAPFECFGSPFLSY